MKSVIERKKTFRLIEGKTYRVGRKDSDLCLGGDDCSISRNHAEITLITKDGELVLQVQDKGSRYGTYINNNIQPIDFTKKSSDNTNNRMEPNSVAILKTGDKIRFGLQWHIWFVYKYTYVVTSSKLDPAVTSQLKDLLQDMSIPYHNDWTDASTHLTMSGIVVTPKVVSALASVKHIVTPAFWSSLSKVLTSGSGWYPKEEDYVPPVVEQAAKYESVSFLPNPKRRCLFQGLKFVAMSQQQMKYLEQCVTLAGGTIMNMMSKQSFAKKDLLDDKTIVLTKSSLHVESQQTQVNNVVEKLKQLFAKTNKRLVDESELGYAIMFASRESACNPYVPFNPPQSNSQANDTRNSTSTQQDSHVFSVSMITTQKTPKLSRKRGRSPLSSERESKKLVTDSATLTQKIPRDNPASEDFAQSEVIAHSGEIMTFHDTDVIQPTNKVESEVYELEDNSPDEVDADNSRHKQAPRRRYMENDSSEDELENLFSKCQRMIKTKTTPSRIEPTNILSDKVNNMDKDTLVEKTNLVRTVHDPDISDRSSTAKTKSKSKAVDETDDSIFNRPTSSVHSIQSRLVNAKTNARNNRTLDSLSYTCLPSTSKQSGLELQKSFNTSTRSVLNSTGKSEFGVDSDEEEYNIFENTTTSLRKGTSVTTSNASLWNKTQDNVIKDVCLDESEEDNIFGAPTIAKKCFVDASRFQTELAGQQNGESMESRTTLGSPGKGTQKANGYASEIKGGRKRLMEEDSPVENFRADQEAESLQDRGLLRDEEDYKVSDSNCCVISVPFRLKNIPASPRLENRKIFKKQALPGRLNRTHREPITFSPVFANVLNDIKLENCTP
ncbi:hypothetical protein M8J76_000531 [Diaphorina citri]|nr:hypothetical protein M8J76_000531 [Diaphorina citri]